MNYILEHTEICVLAAIGIALVIFAIVKTVQKIGLEKIRASVYQFFIDAEHEFQEGENSEKFEYVINATKAIIPAPFNLLITETLLRKVVQAWFDITKDLLDDGKMNGTSVKEEEEC